MFVVSPQVFPRALGEMGGGCLEYGIGRILRVESLKESLEGWIC